MVYRRDEQSSVHRVNNNVVKATGQTPQRLWGRGQYLDRSHHLVRHLVQRIPHHVKSGFRNIGGKLSFRVCLGKMKSILGEPREELKSVSLLDDAVAAAKELGLERRP